jgi:hypothetical protein
VGLQHHQQHKAVHQIYEEDEEEEEWVWLDFGDDGYQIMSESFSTRFST